MSPIISCCPTKVSSWANMGRLLDSYGSTCICLWGCEAPVMVPPLKKNSPFSAAATRLACLKSSRLSLSVCLSNYLVTTSRWLWKMLNLLKSRRCPLPSSLISRPSSIGYKKGFFCSFALPIAFYPKLPI